MLIAGARKYVAHPDNKTSTTVFIVRHFASTDDKSPVIDITQAESPTVGVADAEMYDAVIVARMIIGIVNLRRVRFKKENQ